MTTQQLQYKMATAKVTNSKQKVVYTQDGVFVHTSVPTHIANIIPGRVSLIEKDNNTYVDWSPCEFDADNFELQTSDCAEWDLITQNKQSDKEQEKRKEEKSKYAINFNINELHSIRRSDPKLAWSYVVFILKDSTTLPALHFHSGGIQNLIQNLQRYVWLTRSSTNYKLFVVADQENEALRMSLDQLQLFTERGPSSSYLSRFINTAYYDGMDALSKVTKYFRDTMDVIQATPTTTAAMTTTHTNRAIEQARNTPKKDAEFEDLGEAVPLPNKPVPQRRSLGEIPAVERGQCLTQDVWASLLDKNGRVINIKKLHNIVFRGGIDKALRKEVWKYLLGYFKYGCTLQSRHTLFRAKEDEYRTMKTQWSTISAKQEKHFSEYRDRKHLVDKDVTRTDRTHPYYVEQEPANQNVRKLYNVLMTYCMYNFDLGYVQGMSDLLSPVLFIMDSEVDAFWCFVGMMKKLAHNFDENQEGMKMQLHQLTVLLKFIDPLFYSYLEEHDSGNMYFCFRWLIINFKREFNFDDIMILWEALWTQNLSPNFHLFICLAILDKHRQIIMEMGFGFNEILKYINDLAYQIDVNETLITAETLCIQLLALSDVPEEVRAIVTGKNVAVMTPDIERPDPFLMLMTGRNLSGLYPLVEEPGPSNINNGMNTSLLNDLSIVKVNEDGTCNDTSPKPQENNVPPNVEQQSDDEIVVLSEEAENIF